MCVGRGDGKNHDRRVSLQGDITNGIGQYYVVRSVIEHGVQVLLNSLVFCPLVRYFPIVEVSSLNPLNDTQL